MSAFDPTARAIDWLDAYRACALERLIDLYDDNATLACGCSGRQFVAGKLALRAYWADRFGRYPILGIHEAQPSSSGITLSYATTGGVVSTNFAFNDNGHITHMVCGPAVPNVEVIGCPAK